MNERGREREREKWANKMGEKKWRIEKETQWNVFDIEFIDSHHTKYIIAFLSIWMNVVFHMRLR